MRTTLRVALVFEVLHVNPAGSPNPGCDFQ